jgi:ANTAR domain
MNPAPQNQQPAWCCHINIQRTTSRLWPHWTTSVERISRSARHRIIDVQGRIHDVIVVAELLRDDGGEVIGTNGFYVDVTFPPEERESFISDAVAEIAANRAVIEQVKGILMIVYRIDADTAFDLLKWRSQAANIKLRVLAEQLLADFRALNYDDTLPPRPVFDQLLLTAHNRVRR